MDRINSELRLNPEPRPGLRRRPMSWLQQIGGLLQQYSGMSPAQAPPDVHNDFQQVAQAAPPQTIANSLAAAIRSNQTPPFGQMVSQMFGQSDPNQRAGLLNTLMGAAGGGAIPGVLSGLLGGGQVTPQQANQVPPQAIQQYAAQAAQQNPGIIDTVSGFYSQHPTLVKSLGAGAVAMMLSHMAQQHMGGGGGVMPASMDPMGDPADQMAGQQVMPASMDPRGDPADQFAGQQVLDASQDPRGDPADQFAGQQVHDDSQDPRGDPADEQETAQVNR